MNVKRVAFLLIVISIALLSAAYGIWVTALFSTAAALTILRRGLYDEEGRPPPFDWRIKLIMRVLTSGIGFAALVTVFSQHLSLVLAILASSAIAVVAWAIYFLSSRKHSTHTKIKA